MTFGKLGEAVGEMLGEVVGAFVGVPLGMYVYPVVVGAFVGVAVSRVTTRSVFKPVPVPKPEHSMMEMCVAVIAFQVMEPVAPLGPHLTWAPTPNAVATPVGWQSCVKICCRTVPAFQHSQFGEVMLWNMKTVLAGVVMVRGNVSWMLMLTDGKLGEAVGEMLGEVVGVDDGDEDGDVGGGDDDDSQVL